VLAVQLGEVSGHLVTERSLQRHRRGLEHHDVDARLARGSGDLQPDPSAADHDHGGRRRDRLAQRLAVLDAAERAGEHGAGNVEHARAGTGGEDRLVVGQRLTVGQLDAVLGRVEPLDSPAGEQPHIVLVVPDRRLDDRVVERGLAHEEVLRQRRTLVRRMLLVADDRDRALMTSVAQGDHGLGRGQSGADEDDVLLSIRFATHD
jgi:hypothetical protein